MSVIIPRIPHAWPTIVVCIPEGLDLVTKPALDHETVRTRSSHFQLLDLDPRLVHQPDPERAGVNFARISDVSAQIHRIHRALVHPEVGTGVMSPVPPPVIERQSAHPLEVASIDRRRTEAKTEISHLGINEERIGIRQISMPALDDGMIGRE